MAFWTTTPEQDPKRNFRFQVFMTGIQDSEPAVWWAKKVTKPNFTVAESKHVYLGLMVILWLHNLRTKPQMLWELLKSFRLTEMAMKLKLGISNTLLLSL